MTTTLSMSTAVTRIAEILRDMEGMERVYSEAEDDENGIPGPLSEFPCAIVYSGPDTQPYILQYGAHRHTYEVRADLFQGGGDKAERAATILPLTDLILDTFAGNVSLGSRVNYCKMLDQGGLQTLTWAGIDYTGRRFRFEVSEQANVTTGAGE